MRFRTSVRLDPSQITDRRQDHRVPFPRPFYPQVYNGPHVIPVPVRHPQTGQVMGIVHIDLRDPFGLGHQIDQRNHRPGVVAPPMHSTRVIYTSPRARQQAQQDLHHHGR